MLKNGHYDWCLFVGQLAIEKILKAIVVQTTKGYAPRIHDLVKLAELTNISFSQEQKEFLFLAAEFNMETRYPEDLGKIYKRATKEFSESNFIIIKELFIWLKSHLKS